MTSPDPRALAAQIKNETGIDVLDSGADAAAAAARASVGLRAAFALVGIALAAAGTVLIVWACVDCVGLG